MAEKVWTSADALAWTASRFIQLHIPNARLDAELLLAHALGGQRIDLYANPERPLSEADRARYRSLIERRMAGEPVAYIIGRKAFRHLTLKVTPAVLVPRPETEMLVEAAVEFAAGESIVAADIGTGSGAVAISVAKEVPGASVYATDVSGEALDLANENAESAGVAESVIFLHGDLFEPLPPELAGSLDAVLSNPPYIATEEIERLGPEVRDHEPRQALDGGSDGLDVIRRLIAEAPGWLRPGGLLAVEIGENQGMTVSDLARQDFSDVEVRKDLAGLDRLLVARRVG